MRSTDGTNFVIWSGSEAGLSDWISTLPLSAEFPFVMKITGEMGMGKSTFARAILKDIFKIHSDSGSPTFPIINTFTFGEAEVHHVDAYRLEEDGEWYDSGLLEDVLSPGAFVMLEWLERFPKIEDRIRTIALSQGRAWIEVGITGEGDGRRYVFRVESGV